MTKKSTEQATNANGSNDFIILDDSGSNFLLWWENDFLGNLWFDTNIKKEENYWEDVKEELSTETDIKTQIAEVTWYESISGSVDAVVIKAADRNVQKPKPNNSNNNNRNIWWNVNFGSWKAYVKKPNPNHVRSNNTSNINTNTINTKYVSSEKNELDIISDNFRSGGNAAVVIKSSQGSHFKKPNQQWNNKKSTPVVKKPEAPKEAKTSETLVRKDEVILPESLTVKEFWEKLWVSMGELIKKFIANKMLLTMNSVIDWDTASLIAEEFGIKILKDAAIADIDDLVEWNISNILAMDKNSETKEVRPPIVTIMWHVDHGKTTLLDYIRKTQITNKEAWWITQSIWWSQAIYNNQKITFIDTPGHELFTSLRARGSKITDIIVIVIAADDGVMKQTVEAINHAKDSWCPIIVAITKIDKWIDNTDIIKSQLAEHELIVEDRWWNIPVVKVSGKTWEWMDELLENILLFSEVAELYCDPARNGLGVVLESRKDVQKWVITNMIVMTGTIKVWDILWIHNTYGKIKKIHNRKWQEVKTAQWWDPVMVLWISEVPEAWKLAEVVSTEKVAKDRITLSTQNKINENSIYNIANKILEWETVQLKLILKADSWWSAEALKQTIQWIELPENVDIKVIHNDIGNFYASDLDLWKVSWAVMLGFNTTISPDLAKKAENMWVVVRNFKIIYELADYLNDLVKWMIKIEPQEVYIWKLEVLGVFFRKANDTIFWWKVTDGEVRNWAYFRIMRDGEEFTSGKITSLQKEQQSVSKIWEWHECGMKAKCGKKIEVWDVLEYYVME